MEVANISLSRIDVSRNHRKVNTRQVKLLIASILEVGLLHPIGVTKGMRLIHGRHRMQAYILMGRGRIPAIVHDLDEMKAGIAEIDENIRHHALSKAQHSKAIARRKELYLALHPETKHGGTPGAGRGKVKASERCQFGDSVSFVDDTVEKTGETKRNVQRLARIGERIPDDVMELIEDSPLANKQAELEKIAALDPKDQMSVVKKITSGKAKTVNEALGKKPRKKSTKKKGATKKKTKAKKDEQVDVEQEGEEAILELKEWRETHKELGKQKRFKGVCKEIDKL